MKLFPIVSLNFTINEVLIYVSFIGFMNAHTFIILNILNLFLLDDPPAKKIKIDNDEPNVSENEINNDNTDKEKENKKIKDKSKKISINFDFSSRCKVCRQDLDDPELRMFQALPNDALEEEVALFDPKLSLFNGTEEDVSFEDTRPSNKLTHFRLLF